LHCLPCPGNIKVVVGTSSTFPESSHKNSSDIADAAADCRQPSAASDVSLAGTAEAIACNGPEVKADVVADASGVHSSDETGGM